MTKLTKPLTTSRQRGNALHLMLTKGVFAMAAVALVLSVWTTFRPPGAMSPDSMADSKETVIVTTPEDHSFPIGASSTVADAQFSVLEAIDSRIAALEQRQAADAKLSDFESILSRLAALEQHQVAEVQLTDSLGVSKSLGTASFALTTTVGAGNEPLLQYASLNSPEPSVVVYQDEYSNVFLINSDPALTGNVIKIEALRLDGGVDMINLLVPPPEY